MRLGFRALRDTSAQGRGASGSGADRSEPLRLTVRRGIRSDAVRSASRGRGRMQVLCDVARVVLALFFLFHAANHLTQVKAMAQYAV